MKDSIYVINPHYLLKAEKQRSILAPKMEFGSNSGAFEEFFSYVHPFHAKLLALFDGERTLDTVVNIYAVNENLGYEQLLGFLVRIINNEKPYVVKFQNTILYFPRNLLVDKSTFACYDKYDSESFDCPSVDLINKRLDFPLYITYMINTKCYTDCIYCYADCRQRMDRKIPLLRIEELLEEVCANGIAGFDLMGGEFFLDKDWKKVLKALKHHGFSPFISTKVPISFDDINYLSKQGIKSLQISLDCVNPTLLGKLLNVNGEKYLSDMSKTFQHLTDKNIEIKINSVITLYNDSLNEIEKLLLFLSAYKIREVYLIPAGASIYKDYNTYVPQKSKIALLEEFIEEQREKYKFNIELMPFGEADEICNNHFHRELQFSKRALCTGNLRQVFILPNGDVTICEGMMFNKAFIMGNILDSSLSDIWNENKLSYLSQKEIYTNSPCGKCTDFDSCHESQGVCWKLSITAYGDDNYLLPDPRCPKAPPVRNKIYID